MPRLDTQSRHPLSDIRVITETLIPNMESCTHCDIKKANIFDCFEIHKGRTPHLCFDITWDKEMNK